MSWKNFEAKEAKNRKIQKTLYLCTANSEEENCEGNISMWLHKHLTTIWAEYLAKEDHA